jgi:hypothetical protein
MAKTLRQLREAEDIASDRTRDAILARDAWLRDAPVRIREYNRPLNRLRRRVAELRRRSLLAWGVLRTGETPCDDWD